MEDVFLNLLSDKIAITYGDLNNKNSLAKYNQWFAERYLRVNDYSFIDDDSVLCINIDPNVYITYREIVFLDEETGEKKDILPYREMCEEEFFQYTTVYDFGPCDYDDIRFTQRHIEALQSLAIQYEREVRDALAARSQALYTSLAAEITHEIDKEILEQLNQVYIPTMSVRHDPVNRFDINDLLGDSITNSSVSFTAMNRGNP